MSLNVTRCPNCGSTFNFSPRQLESSGGRARCGACLHIFHPAKNLANPDRGEEPAGSVFIGRAPEEYSAVDTPAEPTADLFSEAPRSTATEPTQAPEPLEQTAADTPPNPPISGPAAGAEFREKFEVLPQQERTAPRQFKPAIKSPPAKRFSRGTFVAQTALALLLLVLLAAQYLWRNLPVLSQVDWLRPGYALVCAGAGCELPPFSAIERIESRNADLLAHPDHPDAWLLRVEILNTAQFAQAFPVLVLRFTSADGGAMALREFAPAEYLGPEMPADSLLLPDSPVEIALGVVNPGPRTANFEVGFRSFE